VLLVDLFGQLVELVLLLLSKGCQLNLILRLYLLQVSLQLQKFRIAFFDRLHLQETMSKIVNIKAEIFPVLNFVLPLVVVSSISGF